MSEITNNPTQPRVALKRLTQKELKDYAVPTYNKNDKKFVHSSAKKDSLLSTSQDNSFHKSFGSFVPNDSGDLNSESSLDQVEIMPSKGKSKRLNSSFTTSRSKMPRKAKLDGEKRRSNAECYQVGSDTDPDDVDTDPVWKPSQDENRDMTKQKPVKSNQSLQYGENCEPINPAVNIKSSPSIKSNSNVQISTISSSSSNPAKSNLVSSNNKPKSVHSLPNNNKSASDFPTIPKNIVPRPYTSSVPTNPKFPHSFQKGDFVVALKDETNYDNYPIWKIDAGKLLQKYSIFHVDGKAYHQSLCTYSSWSLSVRDKYQAIMVNMIVSHKNKEVVQVQDKYAYKDPNSADNTSDLLDQATVVNENTTDITVQDTVLSPATSNDVKDKNKSLSGDSSSTTSSSIDIDNKSDVPKLAGPIIDPIPPPAPPVTTLEPVSFSPYKTKEGIIKIEPNALDCAPPRASFDSSSVLEIYIQIIVSRALDPGFLAAIQDTTDDYYRTPLTTVRNLRERKINFLKKELDLKEDFMASLEKFPYLELCKFEEPIGELCEATGDASNAPNYTCLLSGMPYHSQTLSILKECIDDNNFRKFKIGGGKLALQIQDLHSLFHFSHQLFKKAEEKVQSINKLKKKLDISEMLAEVLGDQAWIDQTLKSFEIFDD